MSRAPRALARAGALLVPLAAVTGAGAAPPRSTCPTVARVDVLVAPELVVTTTELVVPRGAVPDGAFDVFVAFGAPGLPRAADAALVALELGELEAPPDRRGAPLTASQVVKRPSSVNLTVGRPTMAGVVVKVGDTERRRAAGRAGAVAVRVRFAYATPPAAADGTREVLVRLGEASGVPLALGRVRVVTPGEAPLPADARLCGPDADARPLAVRSARGEPVTLVVPGAPALPAVAPIAPVLAVRHVADDLCVRFAGPRP